LLTVVLYACLGYFAGVTTTRHALRAVSPARSRWLEIIEQLAPVLQYGGVDAWTPVHIRRSPSAWGGWEVTPTAAGTDGPATGEPVFLDFGQHLVGEVRLCLAEGGGTVRPLSVRVGESPAEVAEHPADHSGTQWERWLAAAALTPDSQREYALPQRRALRFVRIDGLYASSLSNLSVRVLTQTSAASSPPPLPDDVPELHRQLDAAAVRTLRNCMQEVFEDGPKRDRRLWLGDLRLQAQVNYRTFRNFELVRRCLYLHATHLREDGTVPACVYRLPDWHIGPEFIPDYALLFGPALFDYVRASGDLGTGVDLLPVALQQIELLGRRFIDADGLFQAPPGIWQFIDWSDQLDRQAAEQGTFLYSLRETRSLCRLLGEAQHAHRLSSLHDRLRAAARSQLWDAGAGLFVSGPNKQVSWASQIWMALGGAFDGVASVRCAFRRLLRPSNGLRVIKPVTPYLYHHAVQAMMDCGMEVEAWELLESYWGGMLQRGADTFWEVYDPDDWRLSPYGNSLHNSLCHAWSCTPAMFVRDRYLPPHRDRAGRALHRIQPSEYRS
jgi:alpha-L-rhamnosidase